MQLKIKGQRKSKVDKKVYIGYLLLMAIIGSSGGYFLAKEKYDVVQADVYKCYYGEPRSGFSTQYEINTTWFDIYCYNESIGCPGPKGTYEEKYNRTITTYKSTIDTVMLNYSRGAVLDTEQIRAAFSELCRFGFCGHNTSPYLDATNHTFLVGP